MSDNDNGISKLPYEVDDKVSGQLTTLNRGLLAKPQFWVILAVLAVIAYLIFRRQQLQKEKQNVEVDETERLEDPEAQMNEQQLNQVETGSVKSTDEKNVDDQVVNEESTTKKE